MRRVFLSVANREHEGFRAQLRDLLTRTQFFDVVVQPDFPHTATDTVHKLDALIAPCHLLVHIVGKDPGSRASGESVTDFFRDTDRTAFLASLPKARALLGDFTQLTYFQWEPWLALHRNVDVLVYAEEGHKASDHPQRDHLDALYLARKHAETLQDPQRRCAQIVADVCQHFGILPPAVQQKVAPGRLVSRHTAADFLGREKELALLDAAWAGPRKANVFGVIAWGGVGKTALLARWVQSRFAEKDWKNAEGHPDPLRYFDWTFYDQGTRSDDDTRAGVASVDLFFEAALSFFGDEAPHRPGKGARLAGLVQAHRSLLVLDGLEPLQYPLNHPQAGQLTDPDLRELLATLAQRNPGLCLVSSRQALTDLRGAVQTTAPQHDLEELSEDVAIRLLRQLQVAGSDEDLRQAAKDYAGHALSLILLGRFLFTAKGGDIRKRDTVRLEKANDLRTAQTRNAWHVLEAYEQWLASPQGRPEDRQALRLAGLFDRPASPGCLAALRAAPAIPDLTDRLVPLDPDAWNALLHRLHEAHLIQLRFPATGENHNAPRPEAREVPVDVHPLIREYFAKQLREKHPAAFRAAHSRLFDHLCATTPHQPDTLPGLQPLYQAVTHGCLAGRQKEAREKVYRDRILRGTGSDGFYSTRKLGAVGADLGAVAAFFEEPWVRLSANLSAPDQAWLLNEAASRLGALGRLTEAVEPMRVTLKINEKAGQWKHAAVVAGNLSELEVILGQLSAAVDDARRAIEFADRSADAFWKMGNRTTAADALHQAGERAEAAALLAEAEGMQAESQPQFPMLYSVPGFRFADLLLAPAERAAWLFLLECGSTTLPLSVRAPEDSAELRSASGTAIADAPTHPLAACTEAGRRASEIFRWRKGTTWNPACDSVLDIALDHLTQARAALYRALLTPNSGHPPPSTVADALAGLRAANDLGYFPRALLAAALYHGTLGGDPAAAARLLDEAQQIAERGPMPLYLADVHLHRARLVGRLPKEARDRGFPGVDPRAELAKARELIERHGYWRRREELADAEAAALHW